MNEKLLSEDDAARSAVANENALSALSDDDGTGRENFLTVRGYRFLIKEDAEAARTDQIRIEHLNRYLSNGKSANIKMLYEKAIQNRIFTTPVGWEYLQDLRSMLMDQGYEPDELSSIPVPVTFTRRGLSGDHRVKERIIQPPRQKPGFGMGLSVAVNVILVLLVIVMFIVAATSKTDNIINYRRNVLNEYSSWAEDLAAREKVIRQKERELGVPHEIKPDDADAPDETEDGNADDTEDGMTDG